MVKYRGESYKIKIRNCELIRLKNTFVESYRQFETEKRIVKKLRVSPHRHANIGHQPNGFELVIDKTMNKDLGALEDENGDIIGYIDFNNGNNASNKEGSKNEKQKCSKQKKRFKSN